MKSRGVDIGYWSSTMGSPFFGSKLWWEHGGVQLSVQKLGLPEHLTAGPLAAVAINGEVGAIYGIKAVTVEPRRKAKNGSRIVVACYAN